jgi:hypothetical protein
MSSPSHDAQLANLNHRYELEYEMIRATTAFEHAAIQPLFYLNGGALGIFITLFSQKSFDPTWAVSAIIAWTIGLLAASIAAFTGAASQFRFRNLRGVEVQIAEKSLGFDEKLDHEKLHELLGAHTASGNCYRTVAIRSGYLSVLLFLIGVVLAVGTLIAS